MGGDYHTGASTRTVNYSIRAMAILLILAFVGGLAAMGFITSRWDGWKGQSELASPERRAPAELAGATLGRNSKPLMIEGGHGQVLNARLSELEDRMARINVQAEAASGNAARAEG